MNLENIKEGDIFNSYAEFCRMIEVEPYKGIKRKQSQIKSFSAYMELEVDLDSKTNKKVKILKIYDFPKSILKNPITQIKNYPQCILSKLDAPHLLSKNSRTTQIVWKCNCCSDIFQGTPKAVITKNNEVLCKICKMPRGEKIIAIFLNKNMVNYKTQFYFNDLKGDKNCLKFDFAILDNNNNLKGLIEFDESHHELVGQFIRYDSAKNDYCKSKNIPLLRIKESEKNIELRVMEFLNILGVEAYFNTIAINLDSSDDQGNKELQKLIKENNNMISTIEKLEAHIKANKMKIENIRKESRESFCIVERVGRP